MLTVFKAAWELCEGAPGVRTSQLPQPVTHDVSHIPCLQCWGASHSANAETCLLPPTLGRTPIRQGLHASAIGPISHHQCIEGRDLRHAQHTTLCIAQHTALRTAQHITLALHNSLLVLTRLAQVAHSDRAAYRWLLAQAAPLVTSMATGSQAEAGQQEQEAANVAARARAKAAVTAGTGEGAAARQDGVAAGQSGLAEGQGGGAAQPGAGGLRRPGARAETSTQAAGEERKAVTLQAGGAGAGARPPAQSSMQAAGAEIREGATLQASATGAGSQATSVQAGSAGTRLPGAPAQNCTQAAGGEGQAATLQASATGARLPALSAQNTATVLWAYGRVGVASRPLVLALASRCRQLASNGGFTAQGASMALWGLATLRFWDQVRKV